MTAEVAAEFEYDVFISYSRKDLVFARALEKALTKYRPPRDLSVPQRHFRVFRDEADFTGTDYSRAIRRHLAASRKLIVLCSPAARASEYVAEEIELFAAQRGVDDIIPLLIAGVPNNEAGVEQAAQRAFPDVLTRLVAIPIGADYRGFDARSPRLDRGGSGGAWHKLLADIHGLSRHEVERRERRRRVRLRQLWVGGSGAVMAVLAGLALWLFVSRAEVIREARRAEAAQAEAFREARRAEAAQAEAIREARRAEAAQAEAVHEARRAEAAQAEAEFNERRAEAQAEHARLQARRARLQTRTAVLQSLSTAQVLSPTILGRRGASDVFTRLRNARLIGADREAALQLEQLLSAPTGLTRVRAARLAAFWAPITFHLKNYKPTDKLPATAKLPRAFQFDGKLYISNPTKIKSIAGNPIFVGTNKARTLAAILNDAFSGQISYSQDPEDATSFSEFPREVLAIYDLNNGRHALIISIGYGSYAGANQHHARILDLRTGRTHYEYEGGYDLRIKVNSDCTVASFGEDTAFYLSDMRVLSNDELGQSAAIPIFASTVCDLFTPSGIYTTKGQMNPPRPPTLVMPVFLGEDGLWNVTEARSPGITRDTLRRIQLRLSRNIIGPEHELEGSIMDSPVRTPADLQGWLWEIGSAFFWENAPFPFEFARVDYDLIASSFSVKDVTTMKGTTAVRAAVGGGQYWADVACTFFDNIEESACVGGINYGTWISKNLEYLAVATEYPSAHSSGDPDKSRGYVVHARSRSVIPFDDLRPSRISHIEVGSRHVAVIYRGGLIEIWHLLLGELHLKRVGHIDLAGIIRRIAPSFMSEDFTCGEGTDGSDEWCKSLVAVEFDEARNLLIFALHSFVFGAIDLKSAELVWIVTHSGLHEFTGSETISHPQRLVRDPEGVLLVTRGPLFRAFDLETGVPLTEPVNIEEIFGPENGVVEDSEPAVSNDVEIVRSSPELVLRFGDKLVARRVSR